MTFRFVLSAALFSALAAGSAHADTKSFSPALCVPLNPAQTDLTYRVGGITNSANAPRVVLCPIDRDQEYPLQGIDESFVTVHYTTGATAGSITCTLYHGSAASDQINAHTASSGQKPAGTKGLFATLMTHTPGGPNQVDFNLVCQLSPGVTLAHMSLTERGETTDP